jgi:pyruvate carboxylase
MDEGRTYLIKCLSLGQVDSDGRRLVTFEVNGERWFIPVTDQKIQATGASREKAGAPGSVGSPMPGVIVGLKVKIGDIVKEGEPVATLSAMKMETIIPASASGKVTRILVNVGDKVEADDLVMQVS